MIRTAVLAARALARLALPLLALLIFASVPAEARRHRAVLAHPDCNILWPCDGVVASPRGEIIARKVGIGAPQKIYRPRAEGRGAAIVAHPSGCPPRAFCGCGAAVRVFGSPIRSLWLAAAWFTFPRAMRAAGMVAVRRHHVFVLEQHLGGSTWQVYDANSGGHATRIHTRSIAGYTIVNPRA